MAKKENKLAVYIKNIKAGAEDEEIIKVAIATGITDEEAKLNLSKAKEVLKKADEKKAQKTSVVIDNTREKTLDEIQQSIVDKLNEVMMLCEQAREKRRKNGLSDTGHANLWRELNNNKKFAQRYVAG